MKAKAKVWWWNGNVELAQCSILLVTATVKYAALKCHLHPLPKKFTKKFKLLMWVRPKISSNNFKQKDLKLSNNRFTNFCSPIGKNIAKKLRRKTRKSKKQPRIKSSWKEKKNKSKMS
jgi:hypothetical protein